VTRMVQWRYTEWQVERAGAPPRRSSQLTKTGRGRARSASRVDGRRQEFHPTTYIRREGLGELVAGAGAHKTGVEWESRQMSERCGTRTRFRGVPLEATRTTTCEIQYGGATFESTSRSTSMTTTVGILMC